jgi:hypothetical protein
MHQSLRSFVTGCESTTAETEGTARVTAIAPSMHMRSAPEHYGRNLNSFHVHDLDNGMRRMIEVAHHESR